ncbi:hypothetical protein GE253_25460 [Niveispirillum sp. SYP-B3756]|uniref:hypothetical protein n=1 Tax=Niveispirillum sp. SYP-B3756 TaxID=2662178 RepID=UPI001291661E|nr:hypothetical protein [Niveispirillum sp. SYP-B3756]MQP68659.1 hypothetical protein [Niveispirillum sp. SYP-B3756]
MVGQSPGRRFHRAQHLRRLEADRLLAARDIEIARRTAREAAAQPDRPSWEDRHLPARLEERDIPRWIVMDLWDRREQVMRHQPPACTVHLKCSRQKPGGAQYVMGHGLTDEPQRWAIPIDGRHDWLCPACLVEWVARNQGRRVRWLDWQQRPLF